MTLAALRLRSWHLVETHRGQRTLCGRALPITVGLTFSVPSDEKTCERCLLIATKRGLTLPPAPARADLL